MDDNNNRFSFFGWQIKKKLDKTDDTKKLNIPQIITSDDEDTHIVTSAGRVGHLYDVSGDTSTLSEVDLIHKYRDAAEHMELDNAINDIVDEAIASLEKGPSVNLVLDELDYNDGLKKQIHEEFNKIVKLLKFSKRGSELFKRWYIDGKLYVHINIDTKHPENGIQELKVIDATQIKKVKEIKEEVDRVTNAVIRTTVNEYYLYTPTSAVSSFGGTYNSSASIKLEKESVICITSGCTSSDGKKVYSHLHKSLKFLNQLRSLEDALVIYRLARAPERRIFYIDTGNLPTGKSEEYMQKIMTRYKNKIVYDAKTGAVQDERKHMSMLEDFWLPRREGGKGTEISTLPGGDNLGQIEDVEYFRKQLYKSLNIPITRLEPENQFTSGRSTDITRDEVKFQKFINRLRKRFAGLFFEALRVQLQLTNLVSESDWRDIEESLNVDYVQDNHFYELLEYEIMQDRLNILSSLNELVGKYYSQRWIRRNILQMSDEDIQNEEAQIAKEKEEGVYDEEESGGGSRW